LATIKQALLFCTTHVIIQIFKNVSGCKICSCVTLTDCLRLRSFSSTDWWGPAVCMGCKHLRPAGHRQQEQPAQPCSGHDWERKVMEFGNIFFLITNLQYLQYLVTHWLPKQYSLFFEGIVHPKMYLYEFISEDILKSVGNQTVDEPHGLAKQN